MASFGFPPRPLCVVLMSALILGLIFMAVYSLSHGEITYDPLYAGESLGRCWGAGFSGQRPPF